MSESIGLQTAKGTDIPNSRAGEITYNEAADYAQLEARYRSSTEPRTDPCVTYNCHGLTFASRRTGINEGDQVLQTILDEDGYRVVALADVLPGDVVVYFGDDNQVIHTGIVVQRPDNDNFMVPRVVSKWGKFREVVHQARDCPYDTAYLTYYRLYGP